MLSLHLPRIRRCETCVIWVSAEPLVLTLPSRQTIARTHFEPFTSFDFLDLFTPIKVSSRSRANAILWLCYHYLEAPTPNPFADEQANKNPGKMPALIVLSVEQAAAENVDTPDEVEWGQKMYSQRKEFMEKAKEGELEEKERGEGSSRRSRGGGRGGRRRGGKLLERAALGSLGRERQSSPTESQISASSVFKTEDGPEGLLFPAPEQNSQLTSSFQALGEQHHSDRLPLLDHLQRTFVSFQKSHRAEQVFVLQRLPPVLAPRPVLTRFKR